jgi:hypothetical protein
MRVLRLSVVAVLLVAFPAAGWQQPTTGALRIVVLEGEDGVNIIQQRTAVQPVVEVRDRNDLPVAGAIVFFTIDGGGKTATFANNLTTLQVTTNAAGRAAVNGLQPVGSGAVRIQVSATFQGQTATASITQTNFATVAEAASAGRTPGPSQSASPSAAGSGAGAASGASGAAAGAAGAAGAAAGAAAGTGAAAAGGAAGGSAGATGATAAAAGGGAASGGGLSALAIGGIVAGGAAAGLVAANAAGGDDSGDDNGPGTPQAPRCESQLNAVTAEANVFNGGVNQYVACITGATTPGQIETCISQLNPVIQRYLNALSTYCTCIGPTFPLTAEERRSVQEAFNQLRALGFNVGNIPSCYQ